MLDEFLLGGMVQETSKKQVNKAIASADMLQEVSVCAGSTPVQLWVDTAICTAYSQ